METPGYKRQLGTFDGTMLVMGGIIGAGIFLNPAIVAQRVGTPLLTIAAWCLGGAIALAGAFCFAELGARAPRAGGGYVYLRDAFGPLPAFLYGWTLLLVIATGAIAAVAVSFARYATELAGASETMVTPVAITAIVLLSAVNYFGVRPGAWTQNVFTILKIGALLVLIFFGLTMAPAAAAAEAGQGEPVGSLWIAMGTALIPVLFAFGGWQQTNFVAEEMKDPAKTLPRVLVLGVLGVIAVYVLSNVVYVRQLGIDGLAASRAPAADVMRAAVGEFGATFIAAGITASMFGFLNLVILVTPRVYQAMAADGLFFPAVARLHPRHRTPATALGVQAVWAVLLTLSGTYGQLLDYVVFGDWIFFGLTAATLFVYRRRDRAESGNGFRAPGYPLIPALFVLAAAYVVLSSIISNPVNAGIGAVLIGLGVPAYRWFGRGGGTSGRSRVAGG